MLSGVKNSGVTASNIGLRCSRRPAVSDWVLFSAGLLLISGVVMADFSGNGIGTVTDRIDRLNLAANSLEAIEGIEIAAR